MENEAGAGSSQKLEQSSGDGQKVFKRVFKGTKKVIHDLFELKPAIYKENVSYKFFAPKIEEHLHKHFFHSVDRRGMPNNVSSDNAGHFHKLEIVHDKNGGMKVKCGPALRKVIKKVRGKDTEVVEPVFYGAKDPKEIDPVSGKTLAIIDDHTHEIEYMRAEEVTV